MTQLMKIEFKKVFIPLLLAVLLGGCATHKNRKAVKNLKKILATGQVQKAINLVESKKFYPEEHSKLLKLLELGMLRQLKGDHYQSLKIFEKARDLSDKLFTVSIGKKIKSAVVNSNEDNYYGEIYERSLIRFYIALNHYLLYQQGFYEQRFKRKKVDGKIQTEIIPKKDLNDKQRKFHLTAARAVMLEWDSVLSNYSTQLAGDTTYKKDLSSRLFGSFIHEQLGSRNDRTIAIKLLEEAKDILFKNYNIYSAYNSNAKKFIKDYKKLPNMPKKKVQKEYVSETHFAKSLLNYINTRIKQLKKRKKTNLTLLVQDGYIAEKKARLIDIKLPGGAFHGKGDDLLSFTAYLLNASRGTWPSITYELPEVRKKPVRKEVVLSIKDQQGQVVAKAKTVLMNPLSEIAWQTMDNKIASTYAKIGARVAGKHIAAILASYAAYKNNGKNMAGKLIATAMYATANKAIAASEMADIRHWTTLPHSVRMAQVTLPPGKYGIYAKTVAQKNITEVKIKDITIESTKQNKLINLNLY